jgi:hypothetical protein
MLSFLAALVLAAAPSAEPSLTAPQNAALRCGVAFALAARKQAEGDPAAARWPALGERGREYFVRVTAKLIEETGAGREAIAALATRQVAGLQAEGALQDAVSGCLPLLEAAGL